MKFYLFANSFFYFIFSIWCIIKLYGTSRFLGYEFASNSGKVEYLTLYTGMEFGFAVFLAICAYYPSFSFPGLIFCVATYAGIVLTRIISGLYFGNLEKVTYYVGTLELALLIWGVIVMVNEMKK